MTPEKAFGWSGALSKKVINKHLCLMLPEILPRLLHRHLAHLACLARLRRTRKSSETTD